VFSRLFADSKREKYFKIILVKFWEMYTLLFNLKFWICNVCRCVQKIQNFKHQYDSSIYFYKITPRIQIGIHIIQLLITWNWASAKYPLVEIGGRLDVWWNHFDFIFKIWIGIYLIIHQLNINQLQFNKIIKYK